MNGVSRTPVVESAKAGSGRVLYPELWPAEVRAAAILAVAITAVYSGSWTAPVIERPADGEGLATMLYRFGQSLGGAGDARPYRLATTLLHLASATLLFGVLRRVLPQRDQADAFVPAVLGALSWAVHPVLTESVIAPSRGVFLAGGVLALALAYVCAAGLPKQWRTPALVAAAGGLLAVTWWIAPGQRLVAAVKLMMWPAPLIYDHLAGEGGRVFREAGLYLPLAGLAAFVAWLSAKMTPRSALLVFLLPLTALGMLARARTNDYRSSLVLWRDTVGKAPGNARAHRELGRALADTGRARDAVSHFERALALAPANLRTRFDLAAALMTLGRASDAIRQYEAIVREDSNHATAHLELAVALTILGRMAEAESHYQSALAFGVTEAERHRRRGQALAERGDFDAAQAELAAALRVEPKVAETHVVLGMVLSATGKPVEGMKHFVTAVELDPADANARAALGDALLEDLRPAEALSHYEAALRLDPGRAALRHASLGQALARLGRAPEAIKHLEAALALNPENAEARASLELVRAAIQRLADKK